MDHLQGLRVVDVSPKPSVPIGCHGAPGLRLRVVLRVVAVLAVPASVAQASGASGSTA